MRISDWSSDVCSSDLHDLGLAIVTVVVEPRRRNLERPAGLGAERHIGGGRFAGALRHVASGRAGGEGGQGEQGRISKHRSSPSSEEPTSELQSLMRISYAVLCLKKKKQLTLSH